MKLMVPIIIVQGKPWNPLNCEIFFFSDQKFGQL